jgi:polysaccharide biosynthesis transport protein
MNAGNFTLTPSAKLEGGQEAGDLNQVLATFRRRSRLFMAVAVVIVAAVMLVTLQQTPRFTATANVMMDTRKHSVDNIQAVLSDLPDDTSVVDTEVEILKSRSLAEKVVNVLKLDQDPEFNYSLRKLNPIAAAINAPGAAIQSLTHALAPPASPQTKLDAEALRAQKLHESVVDHVLRALEVRRSGLTYVINISFQSKDPAKAAVIANTFADRYLLEQLEAKFDATQQATQWLNERLADLEPQVQAAESAVAQYKASHGLLAAENSTLTEQEISQLNTQLATAQAEQAEQDARVHTAQQSLAGGSTGEDFAGAMNSDVIKNLRAQKAQISQQAADLETKYGPKHPDVIKIQRQLADIDTQIKQELARVVSNLQSEDQVARQRAGSIQASLQRTKGTLAGNNQSGVELADLQRKADAASTLYNSLLNRAKETSTDQGSEQSDARVVSRAKIPIKPSFPNVTLNFVIGVVLGLIGGVGAVLLMEALDSGLATSEDVERVLGVPHLGAIPSLDSTTEGKASGIPPGRYIVDKPLSAFAESFRNLRASILFSKVDTPVKVVILTSSLPGEGKTTTTFCLGRSMAMSGAKTIVVDCDLRRRNINRMLDIEPTVGLIEVLQGVATLDEAILLDKPSGAHFLPLAKSVYTPKDLFGSTAMDRLLAELRQRYDIVLLDTAPVIPVSDTRILAPKADIVVFLVQWRRVPRKAVEAAFAMLTSVGADIAGVALTLVDAREQAKYGYGDAGYYYRSYRKYYAQ